MSAPAGLADLLDALWLAVAFLALCAHEAPACPDPPDWLRPGPPGGPRR